MFELRDHASWLEWNPREENEKRGKRRLFKDELFNPTPNILQGAFIKS